MRVSGKWISDFMIDVPGPVKRTLVNLGLPVAGLEFEGDRNEVIFDGSLKVTRDLRFFWKDREIGRRMFVNIASLKTHYYDCVVDVVSKIFDLEHVRVYGDRITVGNYSIERVGDADLSAFASVYGDICLINGYPSRALPSMVHVTSGDNAITVLFRFGRVGVEAFTDLLGDAYDDVYFVYRGVDFGILDDLELAEMIRDGTPLDELISEARRIMTNLSVERCDDGFKAYMTPSGSPLFTDDRVFIVAEDYEMFREEKENVRRDLIDAGWKYVWQGKTSWHYWKKIGPFNLVKSLRGEKIVFRNGASYQGDIGILYYTNDVWNYLRTFILR